MPVQPWNIYETLGFFYIVIATGLATAGLCICTVTGAIVIYRTYRDSKKVEVEKKELERMIRP